MVAVVLAVVGLVFILIGSGVATLAPGDGQTGMVCYPAWFVGAAVGIAALNMGRHSQSWVRTTVWICAAIALLSVVVSFVASFRYSHPKA